jgi:hypothetical protein
MVFMSSAASAQEVATPPTNKIVLSGERNRVGFSYSLNPDCTSAGEIRSRLVEPPKNGIVEIVKEKGFSSYPKDSQMYNCNEKPSDIDAYYYKSRDGFKGKDRFVSEVFFPSGSYRRRVFNIDVR